MQGIERGHRLLEDHGDLGAPDLAQPRLAVGQKILALEQHLALNHGGAAEQTHDRESGDRFAGAGLADETKGAPALQREGHAVDGEGLGVALPEEDLKIPDVEERGSATKTILQGETRVPTRRTHGTTPLEKRLPGVEGVAHGFADEDQQREHDRDN